MTQSETPIKSLREDLAQAQADVAKPHVFTLGLRQLFGQMRSNSGAIAMPECYTALEKLSQDGTLEKAQHEFICAYLAAIDPARTDRAQVKELLARGHEALASAIDALAPQAGHQAYSAPYVIPAVTRAVEAHVRKALQHSGQQEEKQYPKYSLPHTMFDQLKLYAEQQRAQRAEDERAREIEQLARTQDDELPLEKDTAEAVASAIGGHGNPHQHHWLFGKRAEFNEPDKLFANYRSGDTSGRWNRHLERADDLEPVKRSR